MIFLIFLQLLAAKDDAFSVLSHALELSIDGKYGCDMIVTETLNYKRHNTIFSKRPVIKKLDPSIGTIQDVTLKTSTALVDKFQYY